MNLENALRDIAVFNIKKPRNSQQKTNDKGVAENTCPLPRL